MIEQKEQIKDGEKNKEESVKLIIIKYLIII